MPRVRADDYEDKKDSILNAAASLIAQRGYSGCKMEDIAKACDVSKSMLYHYFARKEDVLYSILRRRLVRILDSFKGYHATAGTKEKDIDFYFRGYIATYLEKTKIEQASHVVALNGRGYLSTQKKNRIMKLEREVLDDIGRHLREINNNYDYAKYRVYSLLLIGMINWVELWYRRTGKMSPDELYNVVTKLFLHGFANNVKAK